ncbi:hypothetical protein EVAR_80829_1 [Eumeta japonica]|uniref:Uncharacterized protein n=1 Tax=Eumeta variegata TaxID=151549 RepID=A0A4C1WDJ0_EUMVA|nr:hypothetical protein EVAR_80829_1 [Eumeta japonica]
MIYFEEWINKNEQYLSICNLALISVPEKQRKIEVAKHSHHVADGGSWRRPALRRHAIKRLCDDAPQRGVTDTRGDIYAA